MVHISIIWLKQMRTVDRSGKRKLSLLVMHCSMLSASLHQGDMLRLDFVIAGEAISPWKEIAPAV